MTTDQLVKVVAAMPQLRQLMLSQTSGGLGLTLPGLESMLKSHASSAIMVAATAYEWDFSTRTAENVDTVAATAEYVLPGLTTDCLQVIAVTYGDDETPIDFITQYALRDKLKYLTLEVMMYWTPERRDSQRLPIIRIVDTPTAAFELQYRYYRNDVKVGEFPDSLAPLLIAALVRSVLPTTANMSAYRTALAEAIGSIERGTGNVHEAVMDTNMRNRNIERAARHEGL